MNCSKKEARQAYMKAWLEKNSEHVASYRKLYREKRNAARRERYATDEAYRKKRIELSKAHRRNRPHVKRNNDLWTKFGIELSDYNDMLAQQNGGCAICGRKRSVDNGKSGSLHVDHDHKTGRVRGILCSSCNFGIGKFQDSPVLLELAAIYLRSRA